MDDVVVGRAERYKKIAYMFAELWLEKEHGAQVDPELVDMTVKEAFERTGR